MRRTRRRVLELGGTALAVGLAGCFSGEDGSGDTPTGPGRRGTDGNGEVTSTTTTAETATATGSSEATTARETGRPPTDLSGYAEWLPAPSAAPFVSDAGYGFRASTPAQLVELGDALGDGAVSRFTGKTTVPGVETLADAKVSLLFAWSVVVLEGDFDREAVEADLEERGFSTAGTHRGFTVFTAGKSAVDADFGAAAVGEGSIVLVVRSDSEAVKERSATEIVVDAKTGNTDRYIDAVPDCNRLVDALGNAHVVAGRTHGTEASFEGSVGEGTATHVGRENTCVRGVAVFRDEANELAIRSWAADAETFRGRVPSSQVDGRVAIADATLPTGEVVRFYFEFPNPPFLGSGLVPAVDFRFEYEETGDGVGIATISHDGGDIVPVDELFVVGSGFADVDGADQTSAGPWQGTVSGDGNEVVGGDFVAVGATDDFEFAVVWEDVHVDNSATLAESRGPES